MKSAILSQSIDYLMKQPDLQKEEFYFLLASFLIYFKSPLKNEKWNTFATSIEDGTIPLEKGLLMTDEERNPQIFKSAKISSKIKQQIKDLLFEQLVKLKKTLIAKYPFQTSSHSTTDIVLIPDIIDPSDTPTMFSKEYLTKQIQSGKYTNELTGHPLSWDIVESIKQNQSPVLKSNYKIKKVTTKYIMDYIQKDLARCTYLSEHCFVCKSKNINFKSIKNYQTLCFCSLSCIEKWDPYR